MSGTQSVLTYDNYDFYNGLANEVVIILDRYVSAPKTASRFDTWVCTDYNEVCKRYGEEEYYFPELDKDALLTQAKEAMPELSGVVGGEFVWLKRKKKGEPTCKVLAYVGPPPPSMRAAHQEYKNKQKTSASRKR